LKLQLLLFLRLCLENKLQLENKYFNLELMVLKMKSIMKWIIIIEKNEINNKNQIILMKITKYGNKNALSIMSIIVSLFWERSCWDKNCIFQKKWVYDIRNSTELFFFV